MARLNDGGFRIYKDDSGQSRSNDKYSSNNNKQDPDLQVAMLQKLHTQTKIFATLVYKGEIKGIRFFDPVKRNFIDIAPWQIHYFNISGMQLINVRNLELFKVDVGSGNRTLVVEYVTQHEIKRYYKPNRMTNNEVAKALSYILNYIEDAEYETIMNEFRN